MSDLKIQSGRFYRTRDGRKVGPMVLGRDALHTAYMWAEDETHEGAWCETGDYGLTKSFGGDDSDIIAEWAEEPEDAHFASREEMVSAIPVPAPDYNDGNWHGWNGGECPNSIHPASVVEFVWHCLSAEKAGLGLNDARVIMWEQVIRFRVVKPYTAPREWWIVGSQNFTDRTDAEAFEAALKTGKKVVHVREVTE